MAKASRSCSSSFRSISPFKLPDDNFLTKVSGWIDEAEAAGNRVQHIDVRFVLPQTYVSIPEYTARSAHGGQCSMQVRDLKPPVQPTISSEAFVQNDVRDRTKSDQGAGSQRAIAQLEVKRATSKPSKIFSVGHNLLPPTNGGNPSGAFQVPQFANTQKQYLLLANTASVCSQTVVLEMHHSGCFHS